MGRTINQNNKLITKISTMKKFFAMENLLKGGYYNIPKVIEDNKQSSCEKTALMANILSYFYKKVYFAKGDVLLDGRIYTCFRGELIVNQVELAARFKTDRRQWNRLMAEFASENIIRTEQLRGGSRIILVGYDAIVGKKSLQFRLANGGDKVAAEAAPRAKASREGVSKEGIYYPEHNVKGCDIPKIVINIKKTSATQSLQAE